MLPLILGGALLIGGGIAALKLLRSSMGSGGQGTPQPGPAEDSSDQPGKEDVPPPPRRKFDWRNQREETIRRVVAGVKFAQKLVQVGEETVGTEEVPSQVPADDVTYRPINGFGEIMGILPAEHAYPDDLFLARVAQKQPLVAEHIAHLALTKPIMGKAKNTLVVLQDCSGSMNEPIDGSGDAEDTKLSKSKRGWAIKLNQRLAERCLKEQATYILIPYTGAVGTPVRAETEDEVREVIRHLPDYMQEYDGGTATHGALMWVLDYVRELECTEARIILASDGQDNLNVDMIRARLKEQGVNLHVIGICCANPDFKAVADQYDELT